MKLLIRVIKSCSECDHKKTGLRKITCALTGRGITRDCKNRTINKHCKLEDVITMETKYICKNCGHDIPCVIEVGRIEDDDINELIKCKYHSRFREVEENDIVEHSKETKRTYKFIEENSNFE